MTVCIPPMRMTSCPRREKPRQRVAAGVFIVILWVITTAASLHAAPPRVLPWWRTAVFYQVYVRSFQDSDGDGIGDLKGVAKRLGYLRNLGVDAIWITPFYPSPMVDFGYDISDHRSVDPRFGTLDDFDALVKAAHAQKIRVLIDVVLNHTSDKHPFFVEACASRTHPRRDWYVWRSAAPGGGPPNRWAGFEPSTWALDPASKQYYYHYFYRAQPDLNWHNPAVREEMFDTLAFWRKRGVDGFRLDAINYLFEDASLRENPRAEEVPEVERFFVNYGQVPRYNMNQPETHAVLVDMHKRLTREGKAPLLVGEIWVPSPADLVPYYGSSNRPEIDLPFNFFLLNVPRLDAAAFRAAMKRISLGLGRRPTTAVLSNHDFPRAISRLSPAGPSDVVGRLLACLLLTTPGTPFIYYGEEIGMRDCPPERIEDVQDPMGRLKWPEYKGRDGARTPMPWDATENGGFTRGRPWLKLAPDLRTRNVQAQQRDRGSLLSWYRTLIALRRAHPSLALGSLTLIPAAAPSVLAYTRRGEDENILVQLNMSPLPAAPAFPATLPCAHWDVLVTSGERCASAASRLAAFEARILKQRKPSALRVRDDRPASDLTNR